MLNNVMQPFFWLHIVQTACADQRVQHRRMFATAVGTREEPVFPAYGPNLRASCRRLEDAGWLRTLRAPNLQLAVELTDAGRAVAQPLLLVTAAGLPADGTSATDLAVELNGITYQACRGDFVVRLDGSTCLQLWNKEGRVVRREGDPLEVAQWLQACHDAGMEVRVQVNESTTP